MLAGAFSRVLQYAVVKDNEMGIIRERRRILKFEISWPLHENNHEDHNKWIPTSKTNLLVIQYSNVSYSVLVQYELLRNNITDFGAKDWQAVLMDQTTLD